MTFLMCPFLGLGRINRGDTWLKNRLDIFHRFTLQSILNQTDRNFVLWISWRPQDKNNPIIQQFKRDLDRIMDLRVVFTYGGLCFYDDKYEEAEALDNLRRNLEATLPELEAAVGRDSEVRVLLQPSDDMYLPHAVKAINKVQAGRAAGFTKGYIMSYATKEVAEYNPVTSPPFYAMTFQRGEFLSPAKHFDLIKDIKSHEDIALQLGFVKLPGRGFIVGTHGANISTTFNSRFKGRKLTKQKTAELLIATGTWQSLPIKLKLSGRMRLRQIVNRLPLNNLLKRWYYKLPGKYRLI